MRNFTLEDFSGAGQYLIRMSPSELFRDEKRQGKFKNYTDTGFLSTIMYKVGYITNNWEVGGHSGQLTTLTAMSDGWTRFGNVEAKRGSDGKPVKSYNSDTEWVKELWVSDDESSNIQKFCDWLNNPDNQEFRFATQEEVVRVVMYQKSRWR